MQDIATGRSGLSRSQKKVPWLEADKHRAEKAFAPIKSVVEQISRIGSDKDFAALVDNEIMGKVNLIPGYSEILRGIKTLRWMGLSKIRQILEMDPRLLHQVLLAAEKLHDELLSAKTLDFYFHNEERFKNRYSFRRENKYNHWRVYRSFRRAGHNVADFNSWRSRVWFLGRRPENVPPEALRGRVVKAARDTTKIIKKKLETKLATHSPG